MGLISINKDTSVRIDTFEWQVSPNGNNFRLSGIRKNIQLPSIYVDEKGNKTNIYNKNKTEKWHWFYDFIYEDGKEFSIEIDYNNKFVQLIKK